MKLSRTGILPLLGTVATFAISTSASGEGKVAYTDIGGDSSDAGVDYRRVASPRVDVLNQMLLNGFDFPSDMVNIPLKPRGAPGVAVFDYDKDGDLDIYVTNGPGRSNSLYSSQLKESGSLSFVDVAGAAGVELTSVDSSGVCYGDIDNDGDHDLMVLNTGSENYLFENDGNGSFNSLQQVKMLSPGSFSTSCSMGDVNGDGLLDIIVANTYDDWSDFKPINLFGQEHRHQHNQLLINMGDNHFSDRSAESGITNFAGISWAIALVDYDLDGDADLVVADDQGGKPKVERGGKDLGYVRVYNNDGQGVFTDVTTQVGTNYAGAWMGLSFADFNSDGHMDIFASNIGDYLARNLSATVTFDVIPGDWLSTWFLGNADSTFSWTDVGELKATVFGWGTSTSDYDNDGDTDIVYSGGIEMGAMIDGSMTSVLTNDSQANFGLDLDAFSQSTDHARRVVHGLAVGDLNDDGFEDIVSVSNQNWPESFPMMPLLPLSMQFNGPYDGKVYTWPTFMPNDPNDMTQGLSATGLTVTEGTLSVEVSDGGSDNNWVKVKLVGGKGVIEGAQSNRDGIGAVISFTPKGGSTVMKPVVGGASYASQDSLIKTLGLGKSKKGVLEVLWPGGVRNRIYNVKRGATVIVPELPCSFDDQTISFHEYKSCLTNALKGLAEKGYLSRKDKAKLFSSNIRAFWKAR